MSDSLNGKPNGKTKKIPKYLAEMPMVFKLTYLRSVDMWRAASGDYKITFPAPTKADAKVRLKELHPAAKIARA